MMIDALMQRVAGGVSGDTARFDRPGPCQEWAAWAIAEVTYAPLFVTAAQTTGDDDALAHVASVIDQAGRES